MSYVAVLPYVWRPYFDACIATVKLDRERLLLVDNTVNNVGIMRAHNMGVAKMREMGADWLIIMSAAIRFGPSGGLDFVRVLDENPDFYVAHAATANVGGGDHQDGGPDEINGVFGWHLTAFHRRVFDAIGVWDENFSPYGPDDIDLSVRIQKHFKGARGWNTFPVDVHDTTMAHSINLAGVKSPYEPLRKYFIRKWGRDPGEWQVPCYDHPFNDPQRGLDYWPDPNSRDGVAGCQ